MYLILNSRNALKEVELLSLPFPIIGKSFVDLVAAKKIILQSDDEICQQLQNCAALIKSDVIIKSYEAFRNKFVEAWDLLSSSSTTTFSVELPTLYKSHGINIVIDEILRPVWKMIIRFNFPTQSHSNVVGTGESTLICGPVGVGKTTIQISLMVLLFLLTDDILPAYIEYKKAEEQENRLPYNVIRAYASHLNLIDKNCPATIHVLKSLSENRRMVVFFSDDVQKLYLKKTQIEITICASKLSNRLQKLEKQCHILVLHQDRQEIWLLLHCIRMNKVSAIMNR